MLSLDCLRKKDGRRLNRFHIIICKIATQLQLQFVTHFLPVSSVFTHTHYIQFSAFCMHHTQYNTLTVRTRNCRLLTYTPATSHEHAQQSRIWRCRGKISGWQSYSAPVCENRSRVKRPKRSARWSIVVPYITYDLLQTKRETCAIFDGDRFRKLDLYKVQTQEADKTNKKTFQLCI